MKEKTHLASPSEKIPPENQKLVVKKDPTLGGELHRFGKGRDL
jgi:hypothetical protein